MKLREYLESFRDFDPELEIFTKHPDFWTVDKVHRNHAEVIFVQDLKSNSEYVNSQTSSFDKKAILL